MHSIARGLLLVSHNKLEAIEIGRCFLPILRTKIEIRKLTRTCFRRFLKQRNLSEAIFLILLISHANLNFNSYTQLQCIITKFTILTPKSNKQTNWM